MRIRELCTRTALRWARLFAVTVAMMFASAAFAGAAWANDTGWFWPQGNLDATGPPVYGNTGGVSVPPVGGRTSLAETFTVQHTGWLTSAEMYWVYIPSHPYDSSCETDRSSIPPLTIQITAVDASGAPTGPVLEAGSPTCIVAGGTAAGGGGGSKWYMVVNFAHPIHVSAGDQYAMAASSPTTDAYDWPDATGTTTGAEAAWVNQGSGWNSAAGSLWFETYVTGDADPVASVGSGYAVSPFAYLFSATSHGSYAGQIFGDGSGMTYIQGTDFGNIWALGSGGGQATPANQVTFDDYEGGTLPGPRCRSAYTLAKDGGIYCVDFSAGEAYRFDPSGGVAGRNVPAFSTGTWSCPLPGFSSATLATDPASGDLFVGCGAGYGGDISVWRIPLGGGTPTLYWQPPYTGYAYPQPLAFAPDGSLFTSANGYLFKIAATTSAHPGQTLDSWSLSGWGFDGVLAPGPNGEPDVIVKAAPYATLSIDRLNLTTNTRTSIAEWNSPTDPHDGASDGYVDGSGCLYQGAGYSYYQRSVQYSGTVYRITSADGGSCPFYPTAPWIKPKPPSNVTVTGGGGGGSNAPISFTGKGQPGDTVQIYGSCTGPNGTVGPIELSTSTINVAADGSWSYSTTVQQLDLADCQWVFWATESSGGQTSDPSGKTPAFTVDTTPPKIVIGGGFTDGGFVATGGTPTFSIGDPVDSEGNPGSGVNGADTTYTLDGNPYTPGTAITNLGPHTLVVYACDNADNCTTVAVKFTVFAYATGGSFAVGDQTVGSLSSAAGKKVTFWGAQWAKYNQLSGGSAPSQFKGFEDDPAKPSCGTGWTTDPGNSTPPPDSVPGYMAVIVSSSITNAGATISGDTPHIVIVKTDPGYAGNPGHAGTGTIVGALC